MAQEHMSAAQLREHLAGGGMQTQGGQSHARAEGAVEIVLPFPPSVNGYWRNVILPAKGGQKMRAAVLISEGGRKYAKEVQALCMANGLARRRITGDLVMSVTLYPPDRRTRDVDNYSKALLDSLTKAEVWCDDGQLSRLTVERMDADPGNARAEVRIMVRQAQGVLA